MKLDFINSTPYSELFGDQNQNLIRDCESKLIQLWDKYEKKILELIFKETNLKFKESCYSCYLLSNFPKRGISSPLTIKVTSKYLGCFITLIHELLHILMVENKLFFNPIIKKLEKNHTTIKKIELIHVVIFDLLQKIINELFEKEMAEQLRNNLFTYLDANQILKEIKEIEYL